VILRRLVPLLLAAATLGGAALPSAAAADPFAPPKGKVFNGLTAGFDTGDFQHYAGKHPAVWQHFIAWGGSYQYTIKNSARAGARLMLHIGTARGQNMPEKYSPAEIARGQGDQFLVNLTRDIADVGAPVYIRLMGEMNNCNNAYSSYSCGGGRRDAAHSAANWKLAWKRAYLILMGTCLTLFVLAWSVVRFYSTAAAVAMSAVAAVIPPIAVIVANHGQSGG